MQLSFLGKRKTDVDEAVQHLKAHSSTAFHQGSNTETDSTRYDGFYNLIYARGGYFHDVIPKICAPEATERNNLMFGRPWT